jgi:hypothetical protein
MAAMINGGVNTHKYLVLNQANFGVANFGVAKLGVNV